MPATAEIHGNGQKKEEFQSSQITWDLARIRYCGPSKPAKSTIEPELEKERRRLKSEPALAAGYSCKPGRSPALWNSNSTEMDLRQLPLSEKIQKENTQQFGPFGDRFLAITHTEVVLFLWPDQYACSAATPGGFARLGLTMGKPPPPPRLSGVWTGLRSATSSLGSVPSGLFEWI